MAIHSSLNATDKGYSTKAHLSLSPSFIPLRRCHTGTLKLKVSLLFLSTGQNNPSPVIQCFHRELQIIFRVLQFSRFKHFHRDATYLPCFNPFLDFGCALQELLLQNRQQADLKRTGNPDANTDLLVGGDTDQPPFLNVKIRPPR